MKILSISDVITNSSSEVFCSITGEEEVLKEVYDTLDRIFGWNQELEETPVVDIGNGKVTVDLPFYLLRSKGSYEYFREGIQALVNAYDNCKVDFD